MHTLPSHPTFGELHGDKAALRRTEKLYGNLAAPKRTEMLYRDLSALRTMGIWEPQGGQKNLAARKRTEKLYGDLAALAALRTTAIWQP